MKKTSGYFHIVLGLNKMSISAEVNLLMGLNYATDSVYISPSIPQATARGYATTVQTDLGTRLTAPNPTLTNTEKQDVDAMTRALLTIKSEAEVAANKYAQGNRAKFDMVISRIGFTSAKNKGGSHVHIFESKIAGKGMIEITGPSESKLGNATYIFRYNITTAIGTVPTTWLDMIALGKPDVFIQNLPIGTILAIQIAIVVIPSHKKTTGGTGSGTGTTPPPASGRAGAAKAATSNYVTVLPVNAKGKTLLTHGVPFYHFSDTIFIGIS